jgi:hypothetical protein
MPLVGTRSLSNLAAAAPVVPSLDVERWELPGARILQLMYEIDASAMTTLIPPALHPTIPPTLVFTVTHFPESPAGAFVLGEVRVGARSGARPRGLLLQAYASTPEAARELSTRWGYPVKVGDCRLEKRYDRIYGSVEADGKTILDITLLNPEPISGNDVQYLASLNLAKITRDGAEQLRLIQVDPDYAFKSADRGRPQLGAFDAAAWKVDGAVPNHAVSASCCVADISMPALRYLVDPEKPPLAAVERL